MKLRAAAFQKVYKPFSRLTKRKTQINKIIKVTTDIKEIQRIIQCHHDQLYTNKLNNYKEKC